MSRRHIVVLGGGFAGLAAAIELKERLGREHDVVLVSKSKDFVFLPSLIWVPFGVRERQEIVFPLAPLLEKRGIRFVPGAARAIDLEAKRVHTFRASEAYDFLVIATGAKQDFHAVPGLGPNEGHVQSIFSWDDANRARFAFDELLEAPGPVVVGCVQGASTFAPAYEFALNMAHQLKKRDLSQQCPMTFVTPEPFVGHLGTGEFGSGAGSIVQLLERANIRAITNARVERIEEHELRLADGTKLPFAFAMLTPPYVGIDPVRACASIVDAHGFVKVDARLRTAREDVFAAGLCTATAPVEDVKVPCGRPINGMQSEVMGRLAAENIAAVIEGTEMREVELRGLAFTIDAGDRGAIVESGGEGEARLHQLPGVAGHWAKAAFERYFLAKRRRGIR